MGRYSLPRVVRRNSPASETLNLPHREQYRSSRPSQSLRPLVQTLVHIVTESGNPALRDPANHYDRLYKHSCISSLNPAIPPECQASLSSKQRLASELLSQLESNLKSSLPMSEPSCHG